MPSKALKTRTEVNAATRGMIVSQHVIDGKGYNTISQLSGVPKSTVRDIIKHAQKQHQDLDLSEHPWDTTATAPASRSERPHMLSARDKRRLVHNCTKNKVARRRLWIEIAREIHISASRETINKAMIEAGYKRYSPLYKPVLQRSTKIARFKLASDHLDDGSYWYRILFTDECSAVIGDWNKVKVTRLKSERWNADCTEPVYKKYSSIIFWGAIGYNFKGPCYIW